MSEPKNRVQYVRRRLSRPGTGRRDGFEAALCGRSSPLHDLDRRFHVWDAAVSCGPADPNFSFSLAGNAFFIVGMTPEAEREGRRFAWATLVFNGHAQFELLKDTGRFTGLQSKIRAREIALQGSINANLADHGTHSEARQYSGREVDETGSCPFHI